MPPPPLSLQVKGRSDWIAYYRLTSTSFSFSSPTEYILDWTTRSRFPDFSTDPTAFSILPSAGDSKWIFISEVKEIVYKLNKSPSINKSGLKRLVDLIKEYQPDVMVIGSDWKGRDVVGEELVDKVKFFDRVGDYSTTEILKGES